MKGRERTKKDKKPHNILKNICMPECTYMYTCAHAHTEYIPTYAHKKNKQKKIYID